MRNKNKGSAIIEITIMVPILFGCIYFYIMSMLYIVEHGKMADNLSQQLYTVQTASANVHVATSASANVHTAVSDSANGKATDSDSANGRTVSSDTVKVKGDQIGTLKKEGSTDVIKYADIFEKYNIEIELRKNGDDPVKNLRRWQFIADTVR